MTRSVCAVLLLLAGACESDGGHLPISPGGGGGGSSTQPDGGVDGDASTTISGRVCLLGDPRSLTTCASTGAGGLTVALGAKTATTSDTGAFVIDRPPDANPVWRVMGDTIESTLVPLASTTVIPVIDRLTYDDMLAATNAVIGGGTGAIIARVSTNATAVAGITALPSPQADSAIYYDGASVTDWQFDGTGALGIVWIPSIVAGTASLLLDSGTAQRTVTNIKVEVDTISFAYVAAP